MGMSIEELIEHLEMDELDSEGFEDVVNEALYYVRQYKKVSEIVNTRAGYTPEAVLYKISKVVEDGNDD